MDWEEEKCSKYFLSLEKRKNYVNKTIYKLIQEDGDTVTDQQL